MSATYEPGTVAILLISGERVRGMVRGDDWLIVGHSFYKSIAVDNGTLINDVRPLVVLDLPDPRRFWADLGAAVEACGSSGVSARLAAVREHIEGQTRPPRIPEPGLWGVVRSASGFDWVRTGPTQDSSREWLCENGARADWDEITNPSPVRDGIEVAS